MAAALLRFKNARRGGEGDGTNKGATSHGDSV
jgi:hypothetical protein